MLSHRLVRQYILRKASDMAQAKVIITLGYQKYIMDLDKAVQVMQAFCQMEKYDDVYHKEEDGGTTHHIYPETMAASISVISESLYQMAKLAGKPEKK